MGVFHKPVNNRGILKQQASATKGGKSHTLYVPDTLIGTTGSPAGLLADCVRSSGYALTKVMIYDKNTTEFRGRYRLSNAQNASVGGET